MGVRVDLAARTVSASVRDLVASPTRARDVGIWQSLRARIGRDVHTEYGRRRASAISDFRAEVSIELCREIDGFDVTVRGRIDGVYDDDGVTAVEEVKSVLAPGAQLRAATADEYPDACKQVALYALALSESSAHPIAPRVILASVVDDSWRTLEVPFAVDAVELMLAEAVRDAIARADIARIRAEARAARAEDLALPYEAPRPYQSELIDSIAEGLRSERPVLAMAPTGIGKTVSALLPALRRALQTNARVYFATAKGTQQALVARTFEDIVETAGPDGYALRAITLRAKERMCPPGDLACHPDVCMHLNHFDTRSGPVVDQLVQLGGHLSPDRIYAVGDGARLCPFELSLAAAAQADLVIGDYNYAYERTPAETPPEQRTIVVVDEAHNLFDRARGYDSPFASRAAFAEVAASLRASMPEGPANQLALPGASALRAVSELADAAAVCDAVVEAIDDAIADAEDAQLVAEDDCAPIALNEDTWRDLAARAETAIVRYVLYKRARRIIAPRDPVVSQLREAMHVYALARTRDSAMMPFVSGPGGERGAGVGILCVDPSARLAAHHANAAGTVAMSATLAPLHYYRDVLGFRDTHAICITAPSPFPVEHRRVVIASDVSTTYKDRTADRDRIAELIEDVFYARPGNYVAFFPSFAFLADVRRALSPHTAEDTIVQTPRMSTDERDVVLARLQDQQAPRLLFAVMGGIFAEGIDLPGEALVGAIIVSPGLPHVGFERSAMQAYFDEAYGDGFAYAVLHPGMQRVVQSAGRVIRTMSDRGVIALLGRRFAREPYASCLPDDWYDASVLDIVEPDPGAALAQFWSEQDTEFRTLGR